MDVTAQGPPDNRSTALVNPTAFIPGPIFNTSSLEPKASSHPNVQTTTVSSNTVTSEIQSTPLRQQMPTPAQRIQRDVVLRTDPLDLLSQIPGLFRLLDLYSEEGSNGTGSFDHRALRVWE
jgi:hypothetical protein